MDVRNEEPIPVYMQKVVRTPFPDFRNHARECYIGSSLRNLSTVVWCNFSGYNAPCVLSAPVSVFFCVRHLHVFMTVTHTVSPPKCSWLTVVTLTSFTSHLLPQCFITMMRPHVLALGTKMVPYALLSDNHIQSIPGRLDAVNILWSGTGVSDGLTRFYCTGFDINFTLQRNSATSLHGDIPYL